MISEISINNFRHLCDFAMGPLGRITLIGGKNGVGKTAALEALWLLTGPNQPDLSQRLDGLRGVPDRKGPNFFANMFKNFNIEAPIDIKASVYSSDFRHHLRIFIEKNDAPTPIAELREGSNVQGFAADKRITFSYRDSPAGQSMDSSAWWFRQPLLPIGPVPQPASAEGIQQTQANIPDRKGALLMPSRRREPPPLMADRFGVFQLAGKENRVTEFLKLVEPRLQFLRTITVDGTPIVHAYFEDSPPIPVNLVGEGFARIFEICVSLASDEISLVLIDEIENGLHYSTLEHVFRSLAVLTREFGVQIVATTHSRECVRAAHRAFVKSESQTFSYHRMERKAESVKCTHYDLNNLELAFDQNFEVR